MNICIVFIVGIVIFLLYKQSEDTNNMNKIITSTTTTTTTTTTTNNPFSANPSGNILDTGSNSGQSTTLSSSNTTPTVSTSLTDSRCKLKFYSQLPDWDFQPHCENLDKCYTSCQDISRRECNTAFYNDLLAQCDKQYTFAKRSTCRSQAKLYEIALNELDLLKQEYDKAKANCALPAV